jgi:copper homeostasis protein
MLFEICVEGVDGAVAAERGGGDRIELCASLVEGGITPSLGTVRATLAAVRAPVMVMVRPRGGDFLYSALEFASMRDDIAALREAGAAGVVFGCLTASGQVDEERTRELTAAARPLSVTVHRAFDMTYDPAAALEALIRCGVDRVLTSGQAPTANAGLPVLRRLAAQAAERIVVMGCGALRPDTIGTVVRETGLTELHFSAQAWVPSAMRFHNARLTMGGAAAVREYQCLTTDVAVVRATIAAARA